MSDEGRETRDASLVSRPSSRAPWPMTTVAKALVKVKRPRTIQLSEYLPKGQYPIIDQGKGGIAGFTDDESAVIFSPLPITIFGDHTRIVKLSKVPFAAGADGTQLLYPIPGIDPTFFYYAIKNIDLSNYFYARHFKFLKACEFPVPPSPVQRRIANILSAYDDLIENNRKRIALLEESARQLYKEWFVHLRFPGHERHPVEDGVPKGWTRRFLPDLVEINPTEARPKTDSILYVPMSALATDGMTIDLSESELRETSTSVRFRNGDTLLARITPCLENGKTGFVDFLAEGEVACGSTEFIVLRGKTVSPAFVYCLARTDDFRETAIKSMVGSSGRQRVQPACFDEYPVLEPDRAVLKQFDRLAEPVFAQIKTLRRESEKLATVRDALLPRLMKGGVG